MIHRRGLLTGLVSLVAAPAIVPYGNLMPVRAMVDKHWDEWFVDYSENTYNYTVTRVWFDNIEWRIRQHVISQLSATRLSREQIANLVGAPVQRLTYKPEVLASRL